MSANAVTLGRRFFEEVLGTGNWNVGQEIIASDVVMHHPSSPEPISGYEAVKGFLSAFRAGFPDLKMVVEDAFGSGDRAPFAGACKVPTQPISLASRRPAGKSPSRVSAWCGPTMARSPRTGYPKIAWV